MKHIQSFFETTVLEEIPHSEEFASAWNELVLQMEQPEVFLTHEWTSSVVASFEQSIRPFLIVVKQSEELVGLAALGYAQQKEKEVFFLTDKTGDYCDFVSAPEDRAGVIDEVFRILKTFGKSCFVAENFSAASATNQYIRQIARRYGYLMNKRQATVCPQVAFGEEGQRAALTVEIEHKKSIRKHRKTLAAKGAVNFVDPQDLNEVQKELNKLIEAQVVRFLATGRLSPFLFSERRRFIFSLCIALLKRNWLRFSIIRLDNRPISWSIYFVFGGKLFWYLPAFDMEYELLSPGAMLLEDVVKRSLSDPLINAVDLGLGDESYKFRFANKVQEMLQLTFTDSLVRHVALRLRFAAVKFVKRSKALDARLKTWLGRVENATRAIRTAGYLSFFHKTVKAAARLFWMGNEVIFFEKKEEEKTRGSRRGSASVLRPLTLALLSRAALSSEDDTEALNYLLRGATRLRREGACGFVLENDTESLVHFCWIHDSNQVWVSELDALLDVPVANAVVIYDCLTPKRFRTRGFYAETLRLVGEMYQAQGRRVIIYSDSGNTASIRGICGSGFSRSFSVTRKRILFLKWLTYRLPGDG